MKWSWLYESVPGIIISLATILTSLGIILAYYKKIVRWLDDRIKKIMGYKHIIERQQVLEGKIDRILGELTHNGGTSTKDFIKAVNESVLRLESRQQAMLDTLGNNEGVFECTLFGDFIWTNRSLCYMLGRTKQDLLGKGWLGSVSLKHRSIVLKEFDDCIDQNREFELEFDMIRQDQELVKVYMKTTKMMDTQGKLVGYLGSIQKHDEVVA